MKFPFYISEIQQVFFFKEMKYGFFNLQLDDKIFVKTHKSNSFQELWISCVNCNAIFDILKH